MGPVVCRVLVMSTGTDSVSRDLAPFSRGETLSWKAWNGQPGLVLSGHVIADVWSRRDTDERIRRALVQK